MGDTESVSRVSAIGGRDFGISFRAAFGMTRAERADPPSVPSPVPERVLSLFTALGYRPAMPDAPENLTPARRDDLIATLAFVLTRDSRVARMQSAELLASIVAERIVDRLEDAGYVVMHGPPAPGASASVMRVMRMILHPHSWVSYEVTPGSAAFPRSG